MFEIAMGPGIEGERKTVNVTVGRNHMPLAYDEVIDFIASAPTLESVANFRPSKKAQARLETLIRYQKTRGLTDSEESELKNFLALEHIMRMAKAKARHKLTR